MALVFPGKTSNVGQNDQRVPLLRHTLAPPFYALLAVVVGLATVSGCSAATEGSAGDDPGADPAGDQRDTLSPMLRAELEMFCDWWGRTNCELAHEREPHHVDVVHCPDTEARTCFDGFVAENAQALAEGRLVYHPEVRDELAEDLRLMRVHSYSEREALPNFRALFRGTVANGESCRHGEGYGFYANECADGYCAGDACSGTCVPFPGADDECDWDSRRCSPSASCDEGCVERPAEDEPCDQAVDTCLPPLRCRVSIDGLAARCGAPALRGEPCVASGDCFTGACHDGVCALSSLDEPCASLSECEPELSCLSGVCAPRGSGDGGGSLYWCGSDRDCVEEEMCLSSDLATSCGAPVRLGSGCNPYQGCPMGLVCNGDQGGGFGTCVVPGQVGDPCSANSCGLGLHCFEGTCVLRNPLADCSL